MEPLRELINLQSVQLEQNMLSIVEEIQVLRNMPALDSVNLWGNPFESEISDEQMKAVVQKSTTVVPNNFKKRIGLNESKLFKFALPPREEYAVYFSKFYLQLK